MKKSTSWKVIIVLLIFFWPVGLYLLIKKLATDRSAMMSNNASSLPIIAWVLIGFGGIGAVGFIGEFISGDTTIIPSLILALLMLVGGILLLKKAKETKALAAKYKTYINIIVNQKVRNIDSVASAVGKPYEEVHRDLQDMISKGYLNNAYLHEGNHEIVLQEAKTEQQETLKVKSVLCPGCGAHNVVPVGGSKPCEYCGTIVNA